MRAAGSFSSVSSVFPVATALLLSLLLPPAPAVAGAGWPFGGRSRQEGDILQIFDRNIVYVVTNDDAALADLLLKDCGQKERRVLSPGEWSRLPEATRWYVSPVFLINRERLPVRERFPETCLAEGDEVWTQGARSGRSWGVAHVVTISAPDGAWLRRAVEEFRRLKEIPRNPLRRNVHALAVVSIGANTAEAADVYLKGKSAFLAHTLPAPLYASTEARLAHADEVFLVDRSVSLAGQTLPASVKALLAGRAAGPNETLLWRERKPGGRARVVISAPNGDLLLAAARRCPDPLLAPETPSVVATARDLRQVRRIAVAGLQNGAGGSEMARRLAAQTASSVRALDAFEVLERAGLSEILGEIALDQAGITQATDRARVRQLAAADALLIVEVTDVAGGVEYGSKQQRLTPPLERSPVRPLEPTRLRWDPIVTVLPGKTNDRVARAAAEALLKRAIGLKNEQEYRDALDFYNTVTLPRWQRQMDEWEFRRGNRPVSWRQTLVARGAATVRGSLRLVDLVDGLVLWEAPFEATERADQPRDARTVTSAGESSEPTPPTAPAPSSTPPDALVARAADAALARGVLALRGTALLPASVAPVENAPGPTIAAAPESPAISGRLLDVDGDTLLIGLGAGDGLKMGDALLVRLPEGRTVRVLVTRVRPRTCDAAFDSAAPGDLRALVAIGQTAALEAKP